MVQSMSGEGAGAGCGYVSGAGGGQASWSFEERASGRARRIPRPSVLALLTSLAISIGATGAFGCGTSHTQASSTGPFVQSLRFLGPTAFVEECTVDYFETTSHDVSPLFLFFALFSIETSIVTSSTSSRISLNDCVSSSFSLKPQSEQGGPGATPPPVPPVRGALP